MKPYIQTLKWKKKLPKCHNPRPLKGFFVTSEFDRSETGQSARVVEISNTLK